MSIIKEIAKRAARAVRGKPRRAVAYAPHHSAEHDRIIVADEPARRDARDAAAKRLADVRESNKRGVADDAALRAAHEAFTAASCGLNEVTQAKTRLYAFSNDPALLTERDSLEKERTKREAARTARAREIVRLQRSIELRLKEVEPCEIAVHIAKGENFEGNGAFKSLPGAKAELGAAEGRCNSTGRNSKRRWPTRRKTLRQLSR